MIDDNDSSDGDGDDNDNNGDSGKMTVIISVITKRKRRRRTAYSKGVSMNHDRPSHHLISILHVTHQHFIHNPRQLSL